LLLINFGVKNLLQNVQRRNANTCLRDDAAAAAPQWYSRNACDTTAKSRTRL